jgi:hypothetical protein
VLNKNDTLVHSLVIIFRIVYIQNKLISNRNRSTVVAIATLSRTGSPKNFGLILGRDKGFLCFTQRPDQLWGQQVSLRS